MNILLIGNGGREHALAKALYNSPGENIIFASPGNPGFFNFAQKVVLDLKNFDEIAQFCIKNNTELVVIGPEQPLADGLTDYLVNHKINVFGPSKYAAQLESSKDFAKQFMKKYNIPTASFQTFSNTQLAEALNYIKNTSFPVVLKADGLAAGKGVVIANNYEEASSNLESMFSGLFGKAGEKVVIEEFMEGEEASVFAICDGNDYILLNSAQDHKRIADNDEGKNTGGMGAYSPAPIVNQNMLVKVVDEIIVPVLKGMNHEGHPFVGCLYVGLMIKYDCPKVVEFNSRFGDPETQVILNLIEGDFAKLLLSAAKGSLDKSSINIINDKHSCCVVLASAGYPDKYESGFEISGIEDAERLGAIIYHSGTVIKENKLLTNGGRVLAVSATEANLKEAIDKAYSYLEKINFQNMYYRKDIGKKGLNK